jgi:hypothetical protein
MRTQGSRHEEHTHYQQRKKQKTMKRGIYDIKPLLSIQIIHLVKWSRKSPKEEHLLLK